MNSINPNFPNFNINRFDAVNSQRKLAGRVDAVDVVAKQPEARRRDAAFNAYDTKQGRQTNSPENNNGYMVLTKEQGFHSTLLNDIYNKMGGTEPGAKPGSIIEYYA